VEELADMTPEQLEEIPGIGEKTLEKISVAVRHYFGQYEEGEERPAASATEEHSTVETADEPAGEGDSTEVTEAEGSMEKTPEEILAAEASAAGTVKQVHGVSTEEIADAEEAASETDALSDADAREEKIELANDEVDGLVNESQEVSGEGVDSDEQDRG
jgi:N utilization substance protein A